MIGGADGYKDGWILVLERDPGVTEIHQAGTFAQLLAEWPLSALVVDIPIGLLSRGARECDLAARKVLGRSRRSSVFPAPIRPMLHAATWEEGCRIRFALEGKRCSKQAWGILRKVCEVDQIMTPDLQQLVREGHPEVSFAMMNGGKPMAHRKTTSAGKQERLRLLERSFPDLTERLAAFRPRRATVDVLDAYACLWTARRITRLEADSHPSKPQYDERGLRAEIVA